VVIMIIYWPTFA